MKTHIKNLFIAFGLAVVFFFSQAQATTIFPIATNGAVAQAGISAAFSGTNYLVGIQGDAVSHDNITAQLISTNGSLIGSRIAIGRTGGFPRAGFDGTNYLLVWDDDATYPNDQTYGQFISKSGALVGSAFPISASGADESMPSLQCLAFDGSNYLLTWTDYRNAKPQSYGALISPGGSVLPSAIPIASIPDDQQEATVAFGKTNYLVVWDQRLEPLTPEKYSIYGTFVSKSGVPGTPFVISQTTTPSYNPNGIAFDGTNFFVVWNKDIGLGYPNPTIWNFYGRVVSSAGTFPGNEVAIVTDTNSPVYPFLAFDGANYLMAWQAGSTNSQVVFQFFNQSASGIGPEFNLFSPQGTNAPVFGGVLFDGNRFQITAVVGGFGGGRFTSSSGTWGTFIPKSTALPMLTASNRVGTQFPLQLAGSPGINYALQVATNLASPNWTAIVTNSPTNGTFNFTDTHATNQNRFYRAVKQ